MATVLDKSGNSPANGAEEHIPSGSKYALVLAERVTIPEPVVGYAQIFVDKTDGELKIIFGDGTIKTITTA